MGQSLGQELVQTLGQDLGRCAFRDNRATVNGQAINLIEESLKNAPASGILDRADLTTRWGKKLSEFLRVEEPLRTHSIDVLENGEVRIDELLPTKGAFEINVPDLGDKHTKLKAKKADSEEYVMAVGSKGSNLKQTFLKYDSQQALVEKIFEFLSAGAESLEVTIGQEVLVVEYDMAGILAESEKRSAATQSKGSRSWLLTGYIWMVIVSCKLTVAKDPLKRYVTRLGEKKQSKEQLIREMSTRILQEDVDVFQRYATEDDSITIMEQYMQMTIARARNRKFELVWEDLPDTGGSTETRENFSHHGGGLKSAEACIAEMLHKLSEDSRDWKKWQFLINWRPMQVRTVLEAMHEAKRHGSCGETVDHMRCALKAATLAEGKRSDALTASATELSNNRNYLTDDEMDTIVFAGKDMVDNMIERFERGLLSRALFEDHFYELCKSMVQLVEKFLLPGGHGAQHFTMCHRQMADYARYIYIYVPKRREYEGFISDTYRQAEEASKSLPPRALGSITTCVNHAMYYAEVRRDTARAAEICRRHMDNDQKHKDLVVEATSAEGAALNPSEVFNWSLLQHNVVAFETRLVLVRIVFKIGSWVPYRDLVVKGGIHTLDEGSRKPEEGEDASASGASASGGIEGAIHKLEDKFDILHTEVEDQWKSLKKTTNAKWATLSGGWPSMGGGGGWKQARHCFDSVPGLGGSSAGSSQPVEKAATEDTGVNVGAVHSPPRAQAPKLPQSEEERIDLATVHRWLDSCPLQTRQAQDEGEDEESAETVLRSVRWVSHVEVVDSFAEAADTTDANTSLSRSKAIFQDHVEKVKAINAIRRGSFCSAGSRSFLVCCAVRLHPRDVNFRLKSEKEMWRAALEEELREWAKTGSDKAEPKEVEAHVQCELKAILQSLSEEGVVKESRDDLNLNPGDVLLTPGGRQDAESVKRYVKSLQTQKFQTSWKLKFQPCLEVKEATVLEEGPYVEYHTLFQGFPGTGHIDKSPEFTSFENLNKELRSRRQKDSSRAKLPPRRIRNLSARRSPIQASTRGCK